MLGTGAAMVTRCYNTCFTISDDSDNEHFLVDAGGGNGIIRQLELAGIKIGQIHNAFISHNHTDHILGMIWVVRYVAQELIKNRYEGNFTIYGHRESLEAIRIMVNMLVRNKIRSYLDTRIIFHPIRHGDTAEIGGRKYDFFDIFSFKELQHGFTCTLHNGRRLAFLGDEPFNKNDEEFVRGVDIMMHEAYCKHADIEVFNPYPKQHGTVVDACNNANALGVKTLILYHTEGRTLETRQEEYGAEGRAVFKGERLYVPNDLDVIEV